jgi:predicted ATP-dependent serine protease
MAEKSILVPLVQHSTGIRTLKEIQVPEKFFRRMKMEVQVLDELFGGQDFPGLLPGSSILFTGMPGAGKSTAALQFADLLQRNSGRNILYNVGEESEYMVKMRADRLGIGADFGLSILDDVDDLIRLCCDCGVEVLFQDSLQTLRCKETEGASRMERMKVITKKLHRFAKDEDVAVWIIGHITKGGDFAGPMEIKHDVDVHAHIRLNPETMAREFMLTKNRFGPAGIPYECNLTGKGLDFAAMALVENKPDEKKGGSKAAERREAHEKLIREALLKGDAVSAYCQGRFEDPFTKKMGVDCSPGVWRSTLEKVVSALRAEGNVIGMVLKDSRRHYRVEA